MIIRPYKDLLVWELTWIQMAEMWAAKKSKDPSTQVGAVIAKGKRGPFSLGYNGLPMGVEDTNERLNDRDLKYAMMVHAEVNAIILAGSKCIGADLYTWPFQPCSRCAGIVINAGISRVIAPWPINPQARERWAKEFEIAQTMFDEAGVKLELLRHE